MNNIPKRGEINAKEADPESSEVLAEEDVLQSLELNHVSWTNEMTYCTGFFILMSAVVAARSGLFM